MRVGHEVFVKPDVSVSLVKFFVAHFIDSLADYLAVFCDIDIRPAYYASCSCRPSEDCAVIEEQDVRVHRKLLLGGLVNRHSGQLNRAG